MESDVSSMVELEDPLIPLHAAALYPVCSARLGTRWGSWVITQRETGTGQRSPDLTAGLDVFLSKFCYEQRPHLLS